MASAYTVEQLASFLAFIGLPSDLHNAPPSLSLLKQLHTHTISTLPYENLALHYNPFHSITLDPQHLFEKIVTDNRGRGGLCMELALLYNHVLRAVGFDVYTAGVRTRPRIHGVPGGDYPGWGHIVNIVTFPDGTKFYSDIAFGGDGPTAPLPLVEGHIHHNLGTQEVRLTRDWIPTQTHRTEQSKLWIYQYRNQVDQAWLSFYSFPELEFLPPDWNLVNHWMCTHQDSNQLRNLLVVNFMRRPCEDTDNKNIIYGKLMLVNNLVKRNLGGKTETVQTLESETDRVHALEHWFGIKLTEAEKQAIDASPLRLT